MKTGQQVHLKFNPEVKGTVSAVTATHVRVTWPRRWSTVDKKTVNLPRDHYWYDNATAVKVLAA